MKGLRAALLAFALEACVTERVVAHGGDPPPAQAAPQCTAVDAEKACRAGKAARCRADRDPCRCSAAPESGSTAACVD